MPEQNDSFIRNLFEKEREKMLAATIELEVSVFIEQQVALKTNAT